MNEDNKPKYLIAMEKIAEEQGITVEQLREDLENAPVSDYEIRELSDEEILSHRVWHVCSCGKCGLAFAMDDESMETFVEVERLVKFGGKFMLSDEKFNPKF
jgi:hypothetical protein